MCLAYQSNPSAPLWIFFERINMNLKKQTIMEKHVDHHEDATSYSMHWRAALLPKWRYGSFNVVHHSLSSQKSTQSQLFVTIKYYCFRYYSLYAIALFLKNVSGSSQHFSSNKHTITAICYNEI
ncbi:uncharacterized protein LOC120353709 isoform X1 [Nilaparvata lugens]|uniref:uncharacterized protein LOC120353709 isoform X1 n=1 Tax=Nilaparvata lugens TaxID=108931 RepID=UPI00193DE815|nr:uncharacterized protein LOC120353709 isoform X1 [Nilaparvata lugens]XP_039294402.1 uncharacterized protein LOC120353709 isoform X1 [Nilaparvata lugens]XP_039294403.1 uncharacterized protein LOC120353709 isoform X1 [Nilaparvata lugens]